MKLSIHAAVAALVLSLCASCAQATEERFTTTEAAQAPPAGAPDKTSESYGDWTVRCVTRKNLPPCDMVQVATHNETKQQVMSFSIAHAGEAEQYGVQIVVPLGVMVSGGALIRVDDKKDVDDFTFTRCETSGCFIEAVVEPETLDPFRRGDAGVLAVLDRTGEPLVMPVSFTGFADAMDAMTQRNRAWKSNTN